jgi:thiamine transport system permease protein
LPPSADAAAIPPRPLRLVAGAALAFVIATLIVTLFWSILGAALGQPTGNARADIAYLIYITTLQAALSTMLSLMIGIALAWALNRLRFPGRAVVIGLFASAIVTPGLVVAFGLISVWGRSGWLSSLTGHPLDIPIFGLGGVVAAHLILDGAFAARILLARLDAIPDMRLKTGQSLALDAWTRFAIIDWPAIRGTLPSLGAIIFLLAFTSFPIVLLLGGGPAVQTLEVAIYSAVRLDFDLVAAVKLALIQIGICSVIIIASSALAPISSSLDRPSEPRWHDAGIARLLQWLVLILALLGFASPLLAVLADGFRGLSSVLTNADFWRATATSIGIASASACLSLVLALMIASARASSASRTIRTTLGAPAYAYLAVPAVALSLGAFLFVRNLGLLPETTAPIVVVIADALLSLPFAMATLAPPFDAIARSRGKLIRSLNLTGIHQFTAIEWPLVARDAGLVLALGFCFSLGDLGVVALFGTQNFTTLPLLMVRAMGAYRTNDAAAVAALMLVLTIAAFIALPRLFETLADART